MRKLFAIVSLALPLMGCQGPAAPTDSGTPAIAVQENQSWFTHFAPDGSFSLQFPKAPEKVGSNPMAIVLVSPLDKQGSNLSLIQMPLPPGMSAEKLSQEPEKFFGKGVKLVKVESLSMGPHKALKVQLEAGGNRVWVQLILARPWLYQLVALQAAGSAQDFAAERQQFFASFQFTRKK